MDSTTQEEVKKLISEFQIRIDVDTMKAYIGELVWPINEKGHVNPIRKQILVIQDEFETKIKKLNAENASKLQSENLYEDINKRILELALVGFDYEKTAADVRAGPSAIGILTTEVCNFLVETGGAVGLKHSQTLSKLILLANSNTTKDSKESTKSS